MEFCICSGCGGGFEADVLTEYCPICMMAIGAEMQAEHQEQLMHQRAQLEDATRRKAQDEQTLQAILERLTNLRMEYLDDPAKAVEKTKILLNAGSFNSILDQGDEHRNSIVEEVAKDAWVLGAFIETQPNDSCHVRWLLSLACASGAIGLVEFMLDQGVDPNFNSEYSGGPSPLWLVCEEIADYSDAEDLATDEEKQLADDYFRIAQTLVQHGADVNRPLAGDRDYGNPAYYVAGATPLHEAAAFDRQKLAAFLVENGANKAALDRHGRTPYEVAATEWAGTILELLALPERERERDEQMQLDVNGDQLLVSPSREQVRMSVVSLELDQYAVLTRGGERYIQTLLNSDGSFELEYRDGSADRHFRVVDRIESADSVAATFVAYLSADAWKSNWEWEKVVF